MNTSAFLSHILLWWGEGEKELLQSPLSLPFPHLPPFKMLLATKNIQNVMEDPGGMVFKIKYDLLLFRNK